MGHTKMYFPFGALSLVPQIAAFHKKLEVVSASKTNISKTLTPRITKEEYGRTIVE